MAACVARLEHLQGPTGLFDGTNLSSPPDSAFTINDACMALEHHRAPGDGGVDDGGTDGGLADVRRPAARRRRTHHRRAGGRGSAHPQPPVGTVRRPGTGSMRCRTARAGPRPEIRSIGQWLAEGIDQLPDGMYSERSPLYATAVTNPSLLAIADHAGRPELLDHVRRNLTAFLPWFNPDGSTESLFSRRQDQWFTFNAEAFQLLYRRLANQDGRAGLRRRGCLAAAVPAARTGQGAGQDAPGSVAGSRAAADSPVSSTAACRPLWHLAAPSLPAAGSTGSARPETW